MDYSGLMDFNGFFHIYIYWEYESQLTNSMIFQTGGTGTVFFVHSAKGM